MSEQDQRPRIDPSKIRLPRERPKLANCVICGKPHIRRPGVANEIHAVCQKCSNSINPPTEETAVKETIDCNVRGF